MQTQGEPDKWAALPSFAEALGRRLEEVREEAGQTTEDVARHARNLGLTWHRTTVRQTERGNRSATAVELLLLPLLYRKPLRELLPTTSQTTWLTENIAVYGAELHRVLDPGYDPLESEPGPATWHLKDGPERLRALSEKAAEDAARWPEGATVGDTATQPDEAETKAAKRLNTTPEYIAYAARELWSRGLAAERDARLAERPQAPDSPRALQAARGHITRALLTELEPAIREHEKRRGQPSTQAKLVRTSTGVAVVRRAKESE
ncbi:hypothetical protein [Streptomyces sp. 1222.5]|uniref:hypothetical protein n=1 Tax=Streptomyces sp. 1222.5 TaxID=1881026 RepID=UPI003D7180E1